MTLSANSAALAEVFVALEASLSAVASIKLFATSVIPNGAGIRCAPDRASGAAVTIVDLAGDLNVGLPSASFESENYVEDAAAVQWCVDLVSNVARFGVVKVRRRPVGRWRTITETIVLSELDGLNRLGAEPSVRVLETWTPW